MIEEEINDVKHIFTTLEFQEKCQVKLFLFKKIFSQFYWQIVE